MRYFYIVFGFTSLGLGITGAFLPVLPTTVFILIAAYCFSRGSPRLHTWLCTNQRFGPIINQWQQDRSMSPRIKARALVMIALSFGISIFLFVESTGLRFLLLIVAVVLIAYIHHIPSRSVEPV